MKYVDEFRDPKAARALLREIDAVAERLGATERKPLQVMEVCGGHTHSIFRYGLKDLIPRNVEFVHGPGCPVCVLPMGRVDDCIAIATHPGVIFTTFGDAMRVPGSRRGRRRAHGLFAARRAGARNRAPGP
jgi:hydrogenase expression/formation protein HypD